MFDKTEDQRAARKALSSETTGFFKDILSDALTSVIIYILLALAVVIGFAVYFGISFFAALGTCLVLLVGGWAFRFFSDWF